VKQEQTNRCRSWAQYLLVFTVVGMLLVCDAIVFAAPGPFSPMEPMHQGSQNAKVDLMAAAKTVELAGKQTTVELQPVPAANNLLSRLNSPRRGERIYLVLRDLATQEQPGMVYQIYLNLPAGSVPGKDDPHFVGVINFYGAARPRGTESSQPSGFRSFDVTDVLQNLQKHNLLTGRISVTITPAVPGRANVNAKPVIGRIELVAQINPVR